MLILKKCIHQLKNKPISPTQYRVGDLTPLTMRTGTFLYRDGANYKFTFTADIPDDMKVGEETTYEELGLTQEEFFNDIVGYKYDEEFDHNIVELIKIEE